MNILITNDDGIDAQGIHFLAKAFMDMGKIIISAPDKQRSASSHAITIHEQINIKRVDFHNSNIEAYAVSGTPVDCVKLACDKLFQGSVDLILSGINHGANLGNDVLYSGTVSAAIEGTLLGVPSMAVSVAGVCEDEYLDTAAFYTRYIYDKCVKKSINKGTMLNINVPSCHRQEINGMIATCLGVRKYTNIFQERVDTSGNTSYLLRGEIDKVQNGETTDVYAVENSYISVTPMHFELTRFDLIDKINELINN